MTNTKIYAEEILLDEEMEKVSGGTVGELKELSDAILGNSKLKILGKIESHVPLLNGELADIVEDTLKDHVNVDADISLGALGTGICSKKNTYRDFKTRQILTHQEVLNRISKCVA